MPGPPIPLPIPPELIPGLEPMFQLDPAPAPIPADGEALNPPEPDFLLIMGAFLPWDLSPAAARTLARWSMAVAASFGDLVRNKGMPLPRDSPRPSKRHVSGLLDGAGSK